MFLKLFRRSAASPPNSSIWLLLRKIWKLSNFLFKTILYLRVYKFVSYIVPLRGKSRSRLIKISIPNMLMILIDNKENVEDNSEKPDNKLKLRTADVWSEWALQFSFHFHFHVSLLMLELIIRTSYDFPRLTSNMRAWKVWSYDNRFLWSEFSKAPIQND